MNFREHAIAGLATGTAVAGGTYYLSRNIEMSFAMGAVTLAGSLAPDVDCGSIPSRIFAWLGVLFSAYLIYMKQPKYSAYIGMIYMSLNLDHHRGITHKWIIPIVCVVGMLISKQVWPGSLAIGWICHLLCDGIRPWKII